MNNNNKHTNTNNTHGNINNHIILIDDNAFP